MKLLKKGMCLLLIALMVIPFGMVAPSATGVKRTSKYTDAIVFFDNVRTNNGSEADKPISFDSGNTEYKLYLSTDDTPSSVYSSYTTVGCGLKLKKNSGDSDIGSSWGLRMYNWNFNTTSVAHYLSVRYKVVGATDEYLGIRTVDGCISSNAYKTKQIKFNIENDVWQTMTMSLEDTTNSGNEYVGLFPLQYGALALNLPALNDDAYYVLDYIGVFRTQEAAELQSKESDAFWGMPTISDISLDSGTFFMSQTVELSSVNSTQIYYTLDGTTPDKTSFKYDSPITIEKNLAKAIELKAVCYAHDNFGIETRSVLTSRKYSFSEIRSSVNGAVHYFDNDKSPATSEKYGKKLNSGDSVLFDKWSLGDNGVLSIRYKALGAISNNSNIRFISDGTEKTTVITASGEWQTVNVTASEYVKNNKSLEIIFPTLSDFGYYIIDYIGVFADVNTAKLEADAQEEHWKSLEKRESIRNDTAVTYYGVQAKESGVGVRFIGTLDDYSSDLYDKVGFKIQANGVRNKTPIEITKVYTGLIAEGVTVAPAVDGETWFTFCINSIPSDMLTAVFIVSSYAIVNGVEAEGSKYMLEYDVKSNRIINFENMKYADVYFVQNLNLKFENAKDTILNSESEYQVSGSGKLYYVSNNGNDSNSGLSPEQAWATLDKVNSASMSSGSVVLFERGGVWNRQGILMMQDGVTYSAYGTGAKPMISNYIEANKASDWTNVGENLYVYSGAYKSATPFDNNGNNISASYPNNTSLAGSYVTSTNYDVTSNDDIGNIIFDDGKGWGVKVTKYNDSNGSVPLGTVETGFGTLTHNGNPNFASQADLSQHLEFYHNSAESRLYLYCVGGNPSDVFNDIKLVLRGYLVNGSANGTVLDNIALKYAGCHGVSVGNATDFTIRNCEIGWIGGSIQTYTFGGRNYPTRFGEGIQNWGSCDGYYITNNYIYQVYDGAVSSQISRSSSTLLESVVMQNVKVSENVFECNEFSIEFWLQPTEEQANSGKFLFKNHDMSNNMIRKSGYGFGSTRKQEHVSESCSLTTHMYWPTHGYENVLYTGNIMWENREAVLYGVKWDVNMYKLEGNIIVHDYGKLFALIASDITNKATWDCDEFYYDAETLKTLINEGYIGNNTFYCTLPGEIDLESNVNNLTTPVINFYESNADTDEDGGLCSDLFSEL